MYQYHRYAWDLQKSFSVRDTLDKLPDALRAKVMGELHKSLILKIPFFAQCEDIFIDALANQMWLEVCGMRARVCANA